MGQGSNVHDFGNFDSCSMNGTDSRFTAGTGSFYVNFYFAQSQIVGNFGTVGSRHLCSIGGVLFGTLETHFTGRCPGYNLTCVIGERDDHIVEGSEDVGFTLRFYLYNLLLHILGVFTASVSNFCHVLLKMNVISLKIW